MVYGRGGNDGVLLRRSGKHISVEQTRGQRQTGRNDLPGKGERVASGW